MPDRLSPGSGGPLIDPDGQAWAVSRRRLHVRVVRRALRAVDRPVLLGENGGFDLRWVDPEQRIRLWDQLRCSYRGPGGHPDGEYTGHEFVNADGDRLVYIESAC